MSGRSGFKSRLVALAAGLTLAAGAVTADEAITAQYDGFSVVHLDSLPPEGLAEVAGRTERAIKRVSAWLAQSEVYAGRPYDAPIRVLIDPDTFTPAQMRATIFVPESRVRAAASAGQLAEADLGIVHEVTHVLAASAYREQRDRFYDDGLAVYLQQAFGPAGNYPVRGPSLHVATAEAAAVRGGLIPLREADAAKRSRDDSALRRLGYLQLGSFTQFVIENFGIDAYMRIYQGEDPEKATGISFDTLEARWRALIQSL